MEQQRGDDMNGRRMGCRNGEETGGEGRGDGEEVKGADRGREVGWLRKTA